MSGIVQVSAPSRLHFGLWSLAGGTLRAFGGVGAMVERPGLSLRIEPAPHFATSGPLAKRAAQFARRWAEFHRLPLPAAAIIIISAPPQHAGLGTGTQLGLSVAAGLNAYAGLPSQSPQELAHSAGRGLRSAVGTYGFVLGGLIVEQGKLPGEPISPLDCRIVLPAAWRFVLVRPAEQAGLAGDDEAAAIASLPAIPAEITARLIAEARDQLVPAAATGDFAAFAESLYRYGNLSGQCFAARQGGPYNGPLLSRLVEQIRGLGANGVGQSSWGPTLYVAQPGEDEAKTLVAQVRAAAPQLELNLEISPPANRGAQITVTTQ
jgi:beta-ribofuranosylaminobenzene 5'-phosphate synthase